jgi:hypothetical protein
MAEIVFATPIARGKEDLDRQTMDEISGPRRDEYVAALKDAGITRQAIWQWFSQQMREGYGRYFSGPPLPVELISDVRV